MSGVLVEISSTDFQASDFLGYEIYGNVGDISGSDATVIAGATFNAVFEGNTFPHVGLTPGDIWYHWVRGVYGNWSSPTYSPLVKFGPTTAPPNNGDAATQTILGRNTAGTGPVEILAVATVKTMLGLGTAAYVDTGTSGTKVPLLNGTNTWGAGQTISFSISNNEAFDVQNQSATNPYGMWIDYKNVSGGAGQAFITCSDNNYSAVQMRVAGNGNLTNANGIYGTISDAKTKVKVERAPRFWDKVKRLAKIVSTYNKSTDPNGDRLLSLVAQEAEVISNGIVDQMPDVERTQDGEENYIDIVDGVPAVKTRPHFVWKETGTVTKYLKTSVMLLMGFQVTGELCDRMEAVEAAIADLKKRQSA